MEVIDISRINLVLTCIKNIESFDGTDQNQLPDFIYQIENILPSFQKFDGTIENYYLKINELANKMHNRNLTHGDTTYTTQEVNRISLKTFRDHLPEPTRTMIFARDPKSLEDAFKILLGARHQNYTQFGHTKQENFSAIRTNFSNEYKKSHFLHRNQQINIPGNFDQNYSYDPAVQIVKGNLRIKFRNKLILINQGHGMNKIRKIFVIWISK
ncbi:uncharacterized protein LOC118745432 [Rhagoletis pomonella]|uniref:uncharacterized protein LOC118745432 n=1 Tax=Rhagoletis pomonella TaxID=28610 RepID=UPI00177D2D2D|nr:uncharacterized protein LOC118745432 [Rhagoletis pomonella]